MEGEPVIKVQEFPLCFEAEARSGDEGAETKDRADNRGEAPAKNARAVKVDVEISEHNKVIGMPAKARINEVLEEHKAGRYSEKNENWNVFSI